MCALVYSSLFLIFVCSYVTPEAEGLPLRRRERGSPDDIIAGSDFLDILMDSPALHRPYRETTTPPSRTPPVTLPTSPNLERYTGTPSPAAVRQTRSTRFTSAPKPIRTHEGGVYGTKLLPTPKASSRVKSQNKVKRWSQQSSDFSDSSSSRRIINVHITSSVEEGPGFISSTKTSPVTEQAVNTEIATDFKSFDETMLASEEQPSLVAEVNKSEFNVEEMEPITSNSDSVRYTEDLPANVQALPSPKKLSDFQQTSELLKELSREKLKDKLQPYHHTVIYHDHPREPNRARSVSYSSVVQAVPREPEAKTWDQKDHHDSGIEGKKGDEAQGRTRAAESGEFYVTSKYDPSDYNANLEKNFATKETDWEKPEEHYRESSTETRSETSVSNWGISERNYGNQAMMAYVPRQTSLPVIYGQPEQNYEVDEAVSVQTNGRTHGVQSSRPAGEGRAKSTSSRSRQNAKKDDSPKVGYVLEGRKERRYRVEERTSDGFIVGEYGIVNHDDGLLRGVRYTADGTISPRLIYDTLMKFLSL